MHPQPTTTIELVIVGGLLVSVALMLLLGLAAYRVRPDSKVSAPKHEAPRPTAAPKSGKTLGQVSRREMRMNRLNRKVKS